MTAVIACSCSVDRRIAVITGMPGVTMSMPVDSEEPADTQCPDSPWSGSADSLTGDIAAGDTKTGSSGDSSGDGGPLIMNAIRDSETGEMVATDIISASRVTARFRNVAERGGSVSIEFDVTVPAYMTDSRLKLEFRPEMDLMGKTVLLDPLYITGSRYREAQLRGYQRYRAFLESIISDSSAFIRMDQLEKFLMRHYPETYAMKTDSSFISEPEAENVFGVTQREVLRHYTRHGLWRRNEARKMNSDRMFRKFVKDPLVTEKVRLDTVLTDASGDLCYRYVQPVKSFPGLRKIIVSLEGAIYEDGVKAGHLQSPDDLIYYVSSLSSLADETPRYMTRVIGRVVHDKTLAFIDFRQGCSDVDTTLEGNASEMDRIRKCIRDISSRSDLLLDSMTVTASCSPEGAYRYNAELASRRSDAVLSHFRSEFPDSLRGRLRSDCVPENWDRLVRLVEADTVMTHHAKGRIFSLARCTDRDSAELSLSRMPEYRYLREKVYPALRNVSFEFWLHRRNMVQDTVCTTELDTLYMAGVEAMKNLDYKKAVSMLRGYEDYNCALACLACGYDDSALEILRTLGEGDARVHYLTAIALARQGRRREAEEHFKESVRLDGAMLHRANLDPELSEIVR